MAIKINKIVDEKWDCLIILDACRYDFFKALYSKYFSGKLEKRISLGSCTPEWFCNTFRGYYQDIVYVSSNPYINSKYQIKGCNAAKTFYKVIDAWRFCWDDLLGTVHPREVNKLVLKVIRRYRTKRIIVHYLQPHQPYLAEKYQVGGLFRPHPKLKLAGIGIKDRQKRVQPIKESIDLLQSILNKALWVLLFSIMKDADKTAALIYRLQELLRLPPASPMDAIRRKYGLRGLRLAYKENLKIVLQYVAELVLVLKTLSPSKRVVITSDHGELLGEGGAHGHHQKSKNRNLLFVPWFEVEYVKESSLSDSQRDFMIRAKLISKLKAIKHYLRTYRKRL